MGYKIQTTNRAPDSELIEVDDAEFIDLQRWGLIVAGKGDVNGDGKLKRDIAKEAPLEVQTATDQVPVVQQLTREA